MTTPTMTQAQGWRALLAKIGTPTSDGRIFDSLTWRELPLSLTFQTSNMPGHDGAVIVGRIDDIERVGDEVWGSGAFLTPSDDYAWPGVAMDMIRQQALKGVSIDAAVLEWFDDEDGVRHFDGEIGAATLVSFPAFADTAIELVDIADEGKSISNAHTEALPETSYAFDRAVGLVASVGTILDATDFERPKMTKRERLHVEADGRVWGHLVAWGQCHVGSGPGKCVTVDPSPTGYAYFKTGAVLTEHGEVAVGQICLSADHAALKDSWSSARDHYAHTALAVADVNVGDDEYGVWIAGRVRPGTSDDMIHALRASAPSGDWRPIGRALELVAVLAVNTPGFPPLSARIDNGKIVALVASGQPMSDCGCDESGELSGVLERLAAVESDLAGYRAQAHAERDALIATLEADLGLDAASQIAAMEAALQG